MATPSEMFDELIGTIMVRPSQMERFFTLTRAIRDALCVEKPGAVIGEFVVSDIMVYPEPGERMSQQNLIYAKGTDRQTGLKTFLSSDMGLALNNLQATRGRSLKPLKIEVRAKF